MHLILASLGTELLPVLNALCLKMAASLAVLAVVVFLGGIAVGVSCAIIDGIVNHAAGSMSPRKQTGEGSLDQSGDGTPET